MDIIRVENGEKVILRKNATENDFFSLMGIARKRFGIKNINPTGVFERGCNEFGFYWPNAHKLVFFCRGFEFKLDFLPEFNFFD